MLIGKIVSSRSHVDYLCQINAPREFEAAPEPADYAFGQFVRLPEGAVGLIYDSLLQNPDFGNYGPRLATTSSELKVFTPDFVSEQSTLVSILVLGSLDPNGGSHGVPGAVIPVHSEVHTLGEEEIRRFHRAVDGGIQLRYVPTVLARCGAAAGPLLMAVMDRLFGLFEQDRARLAVLRNALNWQLTLGGIR